MYSAVLWVEKKVAMKVDEMAVRKADVTVAYLVALKVVVRADCLVAATADEKAVYLVDLTDLTLVDATADGKAVHLVDLKDLPLVDATVVPMVERKVKSLVVLLEFLMVVV